MAKTFAAQVNRLPDSPELGAALEYLCRESNKLYNCTVYLARQLYFKESRFSHGRWLSSQMKLNPHMKALYTSAAQQTCISVGEAFTSFKELLKLWRKGELLERPKPPNYRTSNGLFQISYPKRWLKLVEGMVRVPMPKNQSEICFCTNRKAQKAHSTACGAIRHYLCRTGGKLYVKSLSARPR